MVDARYALNLTRTPLRFPRRLQRFLRGITQGSAHGLLCRWRSADVAEDLEDMAQFYLIEMLMAIDSVHRLGSLHRNIARLRPTLTLRDAEKLMLLSHPDLTTAMRFSSGFPIREFRNSNMYRIVQLGS
ncbi:myotonin- kinase-like protein [Labeo rohita]|uniref:Myotonin-kinase-like protein n=1 Tax=Labeo rohita TaxID=84645 RepID=A0A498MPI6_LABRO|nr:myotonin- kinase-like protein [Labeo rohita]